MKTVHEKVIQVCGGLFHSHVLVESGKVFSMGSGVSNQLGLEDITKTNLPCLINPKAFNNEKIIQICVGSNLSMALSQNGNVYTWGRNSWSLTKTRGQPTCSIPQKIDSSFFMNEQVRYVTAEDNNSFFVVTKSNKVFSWGKGTFGRLGLGNNNDQLVPQLVDSKTYNDEKVVKICSSSFCTMLLTEDGNVFSCGRNDKRLLCSEHNNHVNTFRLIQPKRFRNEKVKDFKVGAVLLVLTESGALLIDFFFDNLGLTDTNIKRVAHTFVGISSSNPSLTATKSENEPGLIKPSYLNNGKIVKMHCKVNHNYITISSGKIYCWGLNKDGQLGLGHNKNLGKMTEMNMQHFNNEKVISINTNSEYNENFDNCGYSFAITQTGKLFTWGSNGFGQLGLGHNIKSINTPQQCYSEVFGVVPNSKTYKNTSFEDVKIEFHDDSLEVYSDDYCKFNQSFNELYKEVSHIETDMDVLNYDSELEEENQHPNIKQMIQQMKKKQDLFYTYYDVFKNVFPAMSSKDKVQIKKCDRMKQKFKRILK